jgi:hypothetical protein
MMSDIVQIIDDLLAPSSEFITLENHSTVSLRENAIIHKTGRSSLTHTDSRLRTAHREGDTLIATHEPWTLELARLRIGARVLWHETDSHETKNNVEVKVKTGGVIKAGIVIAQPAHGWYPNNEGTGMEPASFVECMVVAESPEPVRFGELYKWSTTPFYPHPKGVLSACPMSVWVEYVRRYQK